MRDYREWYRIEATYPSGRTEIFTKQEKRNAEELAERLRKVGATVNIVHVRGRG